MPTRQNREGHEFTRAADALTDERLQPLRAAGRAVREQSPNALAFPNLELPIPPN